MGMMDHSEGAWGGWQEGGRILFKKIILAFAEGGRRERDETWLWAY